MEDATILERIDDVLSIVSKWNSTAMWSEIEEFKNDYENALLRGEITHPDYWEEQLSQYEEMAGV